MDIRRRLLASSRVLGLLVLAGLLWSLDRAELIAVVKRADLSLVLLAVLLHVPHISLKALRWRCLLRSQRIEYGAWQATLSYLGSMYVGLLTPGRLGEFIRTFHLSRDCGVATGRAFSSVLADRLFDLYFLILVGGAALLALAAGRPGVRLIGVMGLVVLVTLPLFVLLHGGAFRQVERVGRRFGPMADRLFAPRGWLQGLREGMRQFRGQSLVTALTLTILAYAIFFAQCFLVGLAIGLKAGFVPVMFAVALGNLISLIPISISGLGTREAATVAYLGASGVQPEVALAFSLLIFVTFYVGAGLMGGVAWWVKPAPLVFRGALTPGESA